MPSSLTLILVWRLRESVEDVCRSNASGVVCPSGPSVHKHQYSSHAVTDINLDNVCKKGNTLLWDLVQDEDAVNTYTETETHN